MQQYELDTMTLTQRVELATQGKIPWHEVNRPQADRNREAKHRKDRAVEWLRESTPLARGASYVQARRRTRRQAARETRGAVEAALAQSIREDAEAHPRLERRELSLPRYNEVLV